MVSSRAFDVPEVVPVPLSGITLGVAVRVAERPLKFTHCARNGPITTKGQLAPAPGPL